MITVQRWTGRETSALRAAIRMSVRGFAKYLGVGVRTVASWESGGANVVPRSEMQAALDTALERAGQAARTRFVQLLKNQGVGGYDVDLAGDTDLPTRLADGRHPILARPDVPVVDSRCVDGATAAARAERLLGKFLDLEAELGGDQLYVPLASHVERLARLLAGDAQPQLLRAYGQLCQMAGWLAIDSNRHGAARRHLCTCVMAAHEADEPALAASALAYLSLHEAYRENPRRALALARTANEVAAGCGTPRTTTMLATRLARAHAKVGDHAASMSALDVAEQAMAHPAAEPEPLWISYVDAVEVAAQKGACFLDLGLYPQALAELTTAVTLMDEFKPTHTRDLVHYLSRIAKCHLAGGDAEQACASGHRAIDAGVMLGSTRVLERLGEFDASLAPYMANASVRDFHERFVLFTSAR